MGDLISLDEKIKEQEAATEEIFWIKFDEEVTENGDSMSHMEKSIATFACKKCDKILKSQHELRKHMKKHSNLNKKIFNCDYCSCETKVEN